MGGWCGRPTPECFSRLPATVPCWRPGTSTLPTAVTPTGPARTVSRHHPEELVAQNAGYFGEPERNEIAERAGQAQQGPSSRSRPGVDLTDAAAQLTAGQGSREAHAPGCAGRTRSLDTDPEASGRAPRRTGSARRRRAGRWWSPCPTGVPGNPRRVEPRRAHAGDGGSHGEDLSSCRVVRFVEVPDWPCDLAWWWGARGWRSADWNRRCARPVRSGGFVSTSRFVAEARTVGLHQQRSAKGRTEADHLRPARWQRIAREPNANAGALTALGGALVIALRWLVPLGRGRRPEGPRRRQAVAGPRRSHRQRHTRSLSDPHPTRTASADVIGPV